MLANHQPPRIDLPNSWPCCVKSAVLHAIALVQGLPASSGTTPLYTRAPGPQTASMPGCDSRHSQGVSAPFGICGKKRRGLRLLCFNVRQAAILKNLRCEDADQYRHLPVNCLAGRGANFRRTRTVPPVRYRDVQ